MVVEVIPPPHVAYAFSDVGAICQSLLLRPWQNHCDEDIKTCCGA